MTTVIIRMIMKRISMIIITIIRIIKTKRNMVPTGGAKGGAWCKNKA